jgi:hypothetical protein
MQLPTDSGVGGTPDSAPPPLPPQAQSGLPGAAGDLGDIAPAPPAEQPLLQAAFGDQGAAQYQALRAAGQAAPNAGPSGPPQVTTPLGPVGNVVGQVLAGAATHDPTAGLKIVRQQQALQLQLNEQFRRNASEFYTALMPAIFKQFPGRPDLAAAMLMNQARQRNLSVDPAVLMKLNQDMADGKLTEGEIDKIISDPNTPIQTITRLGTYAKFADDLAKGRAEAEEAITKSRALSAPPGSMPTTVAGAQEQAKSQESALRVAQEIRTLQRPPTPQEVQTLDAAGLEAYQVPAPGGVSGATMWSTRPKTGNAAAAGTPSSPPSPTGTISLPNLRAGQAATAESTARARAEVPTAATRTMAEAAPKVLSLVDQVEKDLQNVEAVKGTGPVEGRLRDFFAGKVGAPDPAFMRYRVDTDLLSTLLMRMHVGARGSTGMMEHFRDMVGSNKQSPENMRAALAGIRDYASTVQQSAAGSEAPSAASVPSTVPNAAKVTTRAEVEALPSGAPYINPATGLVLYKK